MRRVPGAEDRVGAEPHRVLADGIDDGDRAARVPRAEDTEALAAEFHAAVQSCRNALRAYCDAVRQMRSITRRFDRKLHRHYDTALRAAKKKSP